MSILLLIVIVIVIAALALYLIDLIPALDGNLKNILKIVVITVAILVIVQRSGLLR